MLDNTKPLLRPLDFQQVYYQGQPMWFLRDPLQLSEKQIFVPQEIAPMLTFLDGKRTPAEIHNAFKSLIGIPLEMEVTYSALAQLDEACLLENKRKQQAQEAHLAEYRSGSFRKPSLAGSGYPDDPRDLQSYLREFDDGGRTTTWQGRGVVSPHIDYARGGGVYAKVWKRAEAAVLDADLVLILGTDHYGGLGTITLTKQPYGTPFGLLPTDESLIDRLAEAWGTEAAFADELHHKHEHSVELSAVWLHSIFYQAGQAPCPLVPVLVGSFQHYLNNGSRPADDAQIAKFLDVLQRETAGQRVVAVASVDLAHVGPAFGDSFLMDQIRRQSLARQDHDLIAAAVSGDAESWYSQIAAVNDCNRICGFSPTYLLLRYLGQTSGSQIAYNQCPADGQETSLVSICGLLID